MQLDDDDLPVGRILDRREAVRLLAIGGAAVLTGCKPADDSAAGVMDSNGVLDTAARVDSVADSTALGGLPQCVAKPELTVGPYFVDKQLERSDIRPEPTTNSVSPGAPIKLTFNVQQIANNQCMPLAGAMVDIWQCDALGRYSGVNDTMVGFETLGQKFLRGYQVTDNEGGARFTTIYPGWYEGRAVHIHFKIRMPAAAALADRTEGTYEFTSQLFFDEKVTDGVHSTQPYAAKGQRTLRNENDGIYQQGGESLVLSLTPSGLGYEGVFNIGLDLTDTAVGAADRSGGPDGRGRGGRRGGPPPAGRRGGPPPPESR